MNEYTVLIYLVFFVALFAATFAYMFKMMTTTLKEFDKVNVKQNLHPEMRDVKSGESLLVFNPQQDDDDDDDEGDVIVVRK
tara:strand:+ start:1014 stop:1256 length:243 start_codon:yes stop_codon:yes gene_type:complete